jgi:predicted nucleic acid-binding protein
VGLTVLDASVVIAVLDADDVHHEAARAGLADRLDAGDSIVVPVSAYAETLVGAFRQGENAAATVDAFLAALPARIEPASTDVAREAARLRARHGTRLPLPDAFVVATALHLGADRILTADRRWPELEVPLELVRASCRRSGGRRFSSDRPDLVRGR